MRTVALTLLTCSLLAAPPATSQVSRVENRGVQAWVVTMGRSVAGRIAIREAGARGDLASLEAEGQTFRLEPGKVVEMAIQPTRNGLALQVTFTSASGKAQGASIFISQGKITSPHTLNINDAPTVHVDRSLYGRAKAGAFITIE